MDRKMSRDDQWERVEELSPGKASDSGRTAKDNRGLVEAGTGSPWRDLPPEFGHWHRTFVRFSRWRIPTHRHAYDKLAQSFLSFVHLACAFVWLD